MGMSISAGDVLIGSAELDAFDPSAVHVFLPTRPVTAGWSQLHIFLLHSGLVLFRRLSRGIHAAIRRTLVLR
jgi:hypothetical protein